MTKREFKVGDRIRFDTHSNLGIREDVIREKFNQTMLREPYARNEELPALVLTEHSWCLERDVLEIVEDVKSDEQLFNELDAYGHLTWTLGNQDWMACFDAIRDGDKIAYHVVVNCESGGFIDTIEKGVVPVAEASKLISLPSAFIDAGIENHLSARQDRLPVGRFAYRDCEKRWAKHIKQLIKG